MGIEGRFLFSLTKLLLSSLQNKFAGRAAAVLGGGPSLPEDLKRVPKDAIMISCNYHGFYHCSPDHPVDFMIYNDDPETNLLQVKAVQEHRAVHVSPHSTTDVIFDVPVWTGHYSSNTAAWFALFLGCDPVILCGMDCYQGPVKHCEPSTYDSPQFYMPLDFYTRPWVEEGRHVLPHVERLRVMSGPLVSLFGAYEVPELVRHGTG